MTALLGDRPAQGDDIEALRLGTDRRLVVALCAVALIPVIGLAPMDALITHGRALAELLALRALLATGLLVAIAYIRRVNVRATLERATTAILLFNVTALIALRLLRPADNYSATRFEVMLVVAVYAGFPLSVRNQAISMLALSAGSISVLLFYNINVPVIERNSIIGAFLVANALGILLGTRRAMLQRSEEKAWNENRDNRLALERTLSELRVLRGIVPICADCHRIRSEQGDWQRRERYVAARTEAQFTHGLCPDCEHKYFN